MAKKHRSVGWSKSAQAGIRLTPKGIGLAVLVVALAVCLMLLNGGRRESAELGSADIRISEVVSDNRSTPVTGSGSIADWIEIENVGNGAVSLRNYSMMYESAVGKLFVFPDVELAAGQRLLVLADGTANAYRGGDYHAPFKLDSSGGATLCLMDASGSAIDAVVLPEMKENWAYCRDDGGAWQLSAATTPGEANQIKQTAAELGADIEPLGGDIEITEVMSANSVYAPDGSGRTHDYVELHNRGAAELDLTGWMLSDDASKLNKWSFPKLSLPADGYLIVYCSGGAQGGGSGELHADFKLSRTGESVYLSNAAGQVVAAVSVPQLEKNQAWSYIDGSWTTEAEPSPGAANGAGGAGQALIGSGTIYISEIMAAPSAESCDWIEICNGSDRAIDLSGCGLSDKLSKPRKWQFPEGTSIQPGAYLCVCCASSGDTALYGMPNTGFALSAAGGYNISLALPDGTIVDSIYLPQQYEGVSYGRTEKGGSFYYLASGTPGTANSVERYLGRAAEAICSVQGGIYRSGDAFEVSLSAEAGSRIYYTLDCSDPNEGSSLYSAPIRISSTTILRTRVYREGYMPSFIGTQSYLYDINNADSYRIVSLVSAPDNLYSDEKGIMIMGPNAYKSWPYGDYGKGANFWMDWEREAHVELFLPDGSTAVSQGCGVKMHGRHSRTLDIKPLKIIARKEYSGKNSFEYPIFTKRDYEQYQSFLLRASGQDYKTTFMRDAVFDALAADSSLMYQEAELCVCYINGEYYSMMYLRERINPYSICQFEGWEGQEDSIDIVKGKAIVVHGSNDSFVALNQWLESHDATTQEAYDMIDANIDIDNFLEYIVYSGFSSLDDNFNVKRYRNRDGDGKWRWILFDIDRGLREDVDCFELFANGSFATLFKACMQNPTIRARFLEIMNDLLADTLSSANVLAKFEARWQELQPLFPDYLNKLGLEMSRFTSRLKSLYKNVERRPGQMIKYCMQYLNISEAEAEVCFADAIAAIRANQ